MSSPDLVSRLSIHSTLLYRVRLCLIVGTLLVGFWLERESAMRRIQKKKANSRPRSRVVARVDFDEVLGLIEAARTRAYAAVNTTLIKLYWSIGEHISRKTVENGWGKGTVEVLAETIQRRFPGMTGFSSSNLWRMSQFFETYRGNRKLAPLVRELSWTHNLLILSRCKLLKEREFYLRMAIREKWGKRELERQLSGALFERVVLSPPKLAPAVRELHPRATEIFKDSYLLEFLDLPRSHSESDLEAGLLEKLKQFLIELGRDFCFIGSQSLVAEYQTRLPDKSLLQDKLHEFYELASEQTAPLAIEGRKTDPRRKKKTGTRHRKQ
jgi:predicted nuclease of restriction endonuclease-like (RecB) superfamily